MHTCKLRDAAGEWESKGTYCNQQEDNEKQVSRKLMSSATKSSSI